MSQRKAFQQSIEGLISLHQEQTSSQPIIAKALQQLKVGRFGDCLSKLMVLCLLIIKKVEEDLIAKLMAYSAIVSYVVVLLDFTFSTISTLFLHMTCECVFELYWCNDFCIG